MICSSSSENSGEEEAFPYLHNLPAARKDFPQRWLTRILRREVPYPDRRTRHSKLIGV
jgi:hypothetical protein